MTVYKISNEPTYYQTPGGAPGVGIRIYASTRPPGPAPEPLPGLLHGAANERDPYGPRSSLKGKVLTWLQAQKDGGTYYEAAEALGQDAYTVKHVLQNGRDRWFTVTPRRRRCRMVDKRGKVQIRNSSIWIAIKQ